MSGTGAESRTSTPQTALPYGGGFSFPSGHVVTYIANFGMPAYLAGIDLRDRPARAIVIAPWMGLLVLIGPSRVYIGAHWASDVLGAYLLGSLWPSAGPLAHVAWLDQRVAPE